MLGHADGLVRSQLAGVRCRGRQGGRDRRAGAGQRQGAERSDRARRDHRKPSSKRVALADPAVQAHTQGKTIRRWSSERDARLDRGRSSSARADADRLRCALASSWLRLRAGRPRLVPAGLHPDRRHPAVREPQHASSSRADPHREGPRRVHRPRQVPGRARRAPAPTRCSPARFSRSASSPSASTNSSSHRAICSPDDEGDVHRRADEQGALVERCADVPR